MSVGHIISLIVFLWLLAILAILRFMQGANPYREDSEEQKAEDREQEEVLARHRKAKKSRHDRV